MRGVLYPIKVVPYKQDPNLFKKKEGCCAAHKSLLQQSTEDLFLDLIYWKGIPLGQTLAQWEQSICSCKMEQLLQYLTEKHKYHGSARKLSNTHF